MHTSGGEREDTPHVHTGSCGIGYTLHIHSAGCENEYTLYVSTTGALQVHTAGVGGTERDIQCKFKLQVVEKDTPCNLASP
jgi:hypothetical protein